MSLAYHDIYIVRCGIFHSTHRFMIGGNEVGIIGSMWDLMLGRYCAYDILVP